MNTRSRSRELKQPERKRESIDQPEGLPVPNGKHPDKKFVYVHYPEGWYFDETHGFLPKLSKIIAMPGCNGVGPNGELHRPIASAVDSGAVAIYPNDTRLGEYQDYVGNYPTTDGRKWWVDFCVTARVMPSGNIIWSRDADAWHGFLCQIRDHIAEPLLVEVYDAMVGLEEQLLGSLMDRAEATPMLAAKVKRQQARIERMRAAWEAMHAAGQTADEAPAAQPKRTRGEPRRQSGDPIAAEGA